MTDQPAKSPADDQALVIDRPRITRWVWQPWYAKLWWASVATYWSTGIGVLWFQPLADFYTSNVGSLLRIALFPVFAFAILSIGWILAWVRALDQAAASLDAQNNLGRAWLTEPYDFNERWRHDHMDPTNIYSPWSGTMFVGHPENTTRRTWHR